jgi:hypothetical protein
VVDAEHIPGASTSSTIMVFCFEQNVIVRVFAGSSSYTVGDRSAEDDNCCSYSYELVRTFFLKIKEYLIRKFFNQKIAFITYELLILN